ncbi:PKD domain-containing protein [Tenacibaculum finnmarkense]|uniref:PKD domain-containing protein n=1 Tax=Tenacibaculum finnmarkense TaxID=2781243 RepID=UPI001E3E932F|nr:PKD domain-containing protein [Tenacibaculum finnmarkense]MCD8440984.1 PKD domain-containing protein [Tenacibaculum finnmarkense genomovar ulcerans]MCG8721910.1 hypothetical protein [Tenacibaculum finnmarkense]
MKKITVLFAFISVLISCTDNNNDPSLGPLVLDFEISINSDTPPAEVTITNNTTGATSYDWSFINGTPTSSTAETPNIITYNDEGEFTIILEATNGTDIETTSQTFSLAPIEVNYSGEWTGTMFLVDEPYDFNGDGTLGNDYKIELPCLIQDITLNEDGTGLFKANIHGGPVGNLECVEYIETPITWEVNEDKTKILLNASGNILEIIIANDNKIERYSDSLLDSDIGISGRIVFERQ